VNTGTSLKVQYGYSQPAGANYSRLGSMTYPNGRVLDYVYNAGVDSDISRLSGISDDAGTGAGNDQSYLYLGLNTIVQATDGNGVALSYIKQPGDTLAGSDGGDQYTGLDRFGRVADQNWVNTSTGVSTDRFQYGYDRSGNVLYKNNLVNSSFSELYHANAASSGDNNSAYDNLNRLLRFQRGMLSASGHNSGILDTVATLNTNANSSQSWALDALGDQTNVTTDGTATGRTINSQNQITAVGSSSLAYDDNGNLTTYQNGNALIYSAWGQLVAMKNGSTALASYVYDANGYRIRQTESSATTDFYRGGANVIEERQAGTVTAQNIWGLMYVNQLVLRDDNSTSGNYGLTASGLGRRIYSQQDANWNVTALVDSSGSVLQRADYTPYGIQSILSSSWATTTDGYGVLYGDQGGRLDPVTGLVRFDAGGTGRDVSPALGRPVEQDPTGTAYTNGADLYQWELSDPASLLDPTGLAVVPPLPPAPPAYVTPAPTPVTGPTLIAPGGSQFGVEQGIGSAAPELGGGDSARVRRRPPARSAAAFGWGSSSITLGSVIISARRNSVITTVRKSVPTIPGQSPPILRRRRSAIRRFVPTTKINITQLTQRQVRVPPRCRRRPRDQRLDQRRHHRFPFRGTFRATKLRGPGGSGGANCLREEVKAIGLTLLLARVYTTTCSHRTTVPIGIIVSRVSLANGDGFRMGEWSINHESAHHKERACGFRIDTRLPEWPPQR
jgi:YD repeat-containing protein